MPSGHRFNIYSIKCNNFLHYTEKKSHEFIFFLPFDMFNENSISIYKTSQPSSKDYNFLNRVYSKQTRKNQANGIFQGGRSEFIFFHPSISTTSSPYSYKRRPSPRRRLRTRIFKFEFIADELGNTSRTVFSEAKDFSFFFKLSSGMFNEYTLLI